MRNNCYNDKNEYMDDDMERMGPAVPDRFPANVPIFGRKRHLRWASLIDWPR